MPGVRATHVEATVFGWMMDCRPRQSRVAGEYACLSTAFTSWAGAVVRLALRAELFAARQAPPNTGATRCSPSNEPTPLFPEFCHEPQSLVRSIAK